MITFSRFGKKGRLGNQLFQLAGMIGLSKKYNQELRLPVWAYMRYFVPPKHTMDAGLKGSKQVHEGYYHYVPGAWDAIADGSYDVDGWLQTEKLWEHCVADVKAALTWEKNFETNVVQGCGVTDLKNAIAISVRRGDYVGNVNYDLLPVSYYMQALMNEFPDYLDRNILIFSDDISYCKLHFAGLPNVWFAEGHNDVVQLCIMSHCNNHIISNSTFSWWGAYLAELRNHDVKIVRPKYLFAGPLLASHDAKDHWPERWTVYDHKEGGAAKKYDLMDVTFTIPVTYDHLDRRQNLDLSVCMLQRAFDTNIIVGEAVIGGNNDENHFHFRYMSKYCDLISFVLPYFHRTKMLNELAMEAKTPIVANFDADVLVPEVQVLVAVEMIRKGRLDGVYPYDGRFARVPRNEWFKKLEKELDLGIFRGANFVGAEGLTGHNSVGGAVIWNRAKFFEGGGENEYLISHAPEDAERWERFRMLGYKIGRVIGKLFHMDHWIGDNSSNRHGYKEANGLVWHKFKQIQTAEAMREYVKSFPWLKKRIT